MSGRITHGHCRGKARGSPSRAYQCWHNMLQRCGNKNHPSYERYGGRGIRVCAAWLSFEAFIADVGEPPPGMWIDRIDNDGGYEPGNVRWASPAQQAGNRRPFARDAAGRCARLRRERA